MDVPHYLVQCSGLHAWLFSGMGKVLIKTCHFTLVCPTGMGYAAWIFKLWAVITRVLTVAMTVLH